MSVPLVWMLASTLLGPSHSSKSASAAVQRAEAHFLAEEYDRASEAFAEAYAFDPDHKCLYAPAQAERLPGDCATAVDLYARFLETDPPEPAATEASLNRHRCQEVLDARRPPPSAPPVSPPPPDRPPNASEPLRDPWGFALLGSGGVAVAVGAGLWGIAIANDREAPQSRTEADFLDHKDKARSRHRAGIAVTSIGGALIVAGIVRLAVLAKRRGRDSTASFSGSGLSVRF